MAALSDSAESFVTGLERAEAGLKVVAHRLEEGFAEQYRRHQVNPFDLAQRIRRLEKQLPEVQQECRDVLTSKQELIDSAKTQLIGNCKALDSLENKSNFSQGPGATETYQAFSTAMAEWYDKLGIQTQQSAQSLEAGLNQALLNSVLQAS